MQTLASFGLIAEIGIFDSENVMYDGCPNLNQLRTIMLDGRMCQEICTNGRERRVKGFR